MLSSRGPLSERSKRSKSRGKVAFEDDYQENFDLRDSISTEADARKERKSLGSGSGLLKSSRLGSSTKLANYEIFSPSSTGSMVKSVINKKREDHQDDKVIECFDELLEKSYNIVSQRDQQKRQLKTEQDELHKKVSKATLDVLPELKRNKMLKETLREAQGVQAKHEKDIEILQSKIDRMRELIEAKKQEHRIKEDQMVETVMRIGEEVEEIAFQRVVYRNEKQQEAINLDRRLDEAYDEEKILLDDIDNAKKKAAHAKGLLQKKQKAMEEKSRAFLGMLQCK